MTLEKFLLTQVTLKFVVVNNINKKTFKQNSLISLINLQFFVTAKWPYYYNYVAIEGVDFKVFPGKYW